MSQNNFSKLIWAGTILALLTPFIASKEYYFPYVGPKSLYFMALAEIVFFAWLALAVKFSRYRPRFGPLTVATTVFLSVLALSALFGANPSLSFWSKYERMTGVLMMVHLFGFYLALSSFFKKNDWLAIFRINIVLTSLMGLKSLFTYDLSESGGGAFGNDSFLGTYLLFNLFIALYLIFSDIGKEKNRLYALKKPAVLFEIICFFAMVFSLFFAGTVYFMYLNSPSPNPFSFSSLIGEAVVTGARAAKISFLGGFVLMALIRLATAGNKAVRRFFSVLTATLAILAVLAIILSSQKGSYVYQKMVERFSEGTIHGRVVVWETAWLGFLDRPLLGWGPENFDVVFSQHFNPCMGLAKCSGILWYDRAHNIFFDTAATTGILGILGYFGLFIVALFVLWKGYFNHTAGFTEAGVFSALLAAYFIQNLTVFDTVVSFIMLFMVFAFIASLSQQEPSPADRPQRVDFWRYFAIVSIFILSFVNFVINPLKTDSYVIQAANKPFGSKARIELYQKTLETSPMGKFQIRIFFAEQWLGAFQGDKIDGLSKQEGVAEFTYLSGELEKGVREAPLDFRSRLTLGRLYNAWFLIDPEKITLAEKALKEAIAIAPANQQGYWNLAQTRVYQGKYDDAMALAKKSLELEPDLEQSKNLVAEIERIQAQIGINNESK